MSAVAARQHGVISRRGLRRIGLTYPPILGLVHAGFLQPVHRGVYAVGHARLAREGVWMAAVLAGGPTAVLSHGSAAALWRLAAPPSLPHITTVAKGLRRPGIRIHSSNLSRAERTRRAGIPVTTVPRTLLDLAGELDAFALERALAEAHFRGHRDERPLLRLIEAGPRRRGASNLRTILDSGHHRLGRTESPLEDRFLRFLDRRRLERPELNQTLMVHGRRIRPDCLWRRQRVIVECDGRDSHLREVTWEADRRRDRGLLAIGLKPVRVTSEQLDRDAAGLEADLRDLGVGTRTRGVAAA